MASMIQQEDEDDDSSSSDSEVLPPLDLTASPHKSKEESVQQQLETFRQKWQHEIKMDHEGNQTTFSNDSTEKQPENQRELEAQALYMQGMKAEQRGHFYDAITFYRRAIQLVPDIEFKMREVHQITEKKRTNKRSTSESSTGSDVSEDINWDDLTFHLRELVVQDNAVCLPRTPTQSTHFGDLPVEVVMHILKWVVSSDLDVSSLESISLVCRGFYLCSRDDEIWRVICQKVWGMNCGRVTMYGSWRNMYIDRPHLRFNGCYIARTSYYRRGEKSLDNLYKPFHLVEYYRYARFLPDGKVLMLTAADDPYAVVSQLKSIHSRVPGLLVGYYKLTGDTVTAVMKRRVTKTYYSYAMRKRNQRQQQPESEQVFHMEFTLKNTKRKNSMLVWQSYSIQTRNRSSGQDTTEFDLSDQSYPQLIFSRVKSYTAYSDSILA